MIILGIETSCDETAAAIVESKNNKLSVLASKIATSQEMHAESGGIIPEKAAREQVKSIMPVIEKAIVEAYRSSHAEFSSASKIAILKQVQDDDWLDAIAVTYGPGLIGSLLVGVETAKTLSLVWGKPIVPVNHLVGHLYSCFVGQTPEFPAVGLVVSGGHTDFVLIKDFDDITYIGGTRDDAAGEAFDKAARIIGLGYPGGPAISEASDLYIDSLAEPDPASQGKKQKLDLFPRPMMNSGDLDMSFSGLKTAVLNYVKSHPELVSGSILKQVQDDKIGYIAANIQQAIIDTIVEKSSLAITNYSPKSFLLSGGVSANKLLVSRMREMCQRHTKAAQFYVPSVKTSTDNATMIAAAAAHNYRPIDWEDIDANPGLAIDG